MPRVSIITATYNRSNVLRYTIESVLRSTYEDWEMLVIGDACTDDSADVVRSFDDPRLRFVNLEQNSGEQAAPNNEGMRLARGELLAFLNHDDFWTPDHLAVCLEVLDATGAELVATTTIAINHKDVPALVGVGPRGIYEPHVFVPASSWVLRSDLAKSVGPWRPARELFITPSQEWIFRAWKRKHRLRLIDQVTVIAPQSGGRRRSYSDRLEAPNAHYATLLRDDAEFIPRMMAQVAMRMTARRMRIGIRESMVRVVKNIVFKMVVAAGGHPTAFRNAIKYRRKGGMLDFLRRNRGLPPLPRRGDSHA